MKLYIEIEELRQRIFLNFDHLKNDPYYGIDQVFSPADYFPLICCRERLLNAGMDINGFTPVTFEELLANNARFKEEYRNSITAE